LSFTADTLVHTENGLKPISEIKVGDKVLSYDERTETTSYQPVMDIIQGEKQYQIINLTLDSGDSIETISEHPFYIKGKGWNPASSLKVGQALQLHDGTTVVVKEIDTSVQLGKVYNITVANTHNYYVGRDGVLVHNVSKNDRAALLLSFLMNLNLPGAVFPDDIPGSVEDPDSPSEQKTQPKKPANKKSGKKRGRKDKSKGKNPDGGRTYNKCS